MTILQLQTPSYMAVSVVCMTGVFRRAMNVLLLGDNSVYFILALLSDIYIIIWQSPYVLFVQFLSPPKPAVLDPPKFLQADHPLYA
jgi:hypothetical protein